MAYFTYHSRLTTINLGLSQGVHLVVPETAKISAFIFVCISLMKLVVGIFNYSHASNRTDRTVERVNTH